MFSFQRYTGIGLLAGVGAMVVLGFAGAQGGATANGCMSNLKQVALGTLMYSQDYDETLPAMKTTTAFQTGLQPYTKNTAIFSCPDTNAVYQPNAKLHRAKMAKIKAPATTWLVSDPKPHADKLWTVAYVDGHVKREAKSPMGATAPKGKKKK